MRKIKNFLNTKMGLFTDDGREILDTTPVAIPVGFKRPDTLPELLARLHSDPRYQRAVDAGEFDSVEDADDFEIDDESDGDFTDRNSPHEYAADQVPLRVQLRQRLKEKKLREEQLALKKQTSDAEEDEAPPRRKVRGPESTARSKPLLADKRSSKTRETYEDSEEHDDDL